MAMLCRAMQRESSIRLTGLCHSVQGTAMMLAHWIGAPIHLQYLLAPFLL
jgi:alpha-galactosidase